MSLDGRGVGLANATNTNTDTTARVHTTARVCINLYNSLADPSVIKRNPAEFKAIKEEIALGLSSPFDPLGMSYAEQRGLAPVFTNVYALKSPAGASGRQDDLMRWYIRYYDCRSKDERIEHCATSCTVKGQPYYPSELYFAGITISEAEADPMNGDTAVTLMIGGKITIQNGRFPISTNQPIMWYFEEEADAEMFDANGRRQKRRAQPIVAAANGDQGRPIDYTAAPSGNRRLIRDISYAERAEMKHRVFIKPYIEGIDGLGATYADKSRVIGKAYSNAGPYERVDVKLCRMSH